MSTANPQRSGARGNPGPRPALQREEGKPDGALVVPRPGNTHGVDGKTLKAGQIRIAPSPNQRRGQHAGQPDDAASQAGDPGKAAKTKKADQSKKDKPKRAKKRASKKAKKGKKRAKLNQPTAPDLLPPELVVALPKPLRRALAEAATERDVTPELLVAQVLSEWLDH